MTSIEKFSDFFLPNEPYKSGRKDILRDDIN